MFKIIFFLFALSVAYFYKVSLDYKNPYKLIMLFGKKGSGKNTLLTKWSIMYNKLGYTVFSDSEIFNTYKLNTDWIGKYDFPKNSVLLIQEAGITWNNRDFKSFPKEVTKFFKLQRHKNVIVVLASQSFDVDKKLRDLTDEMYLITNFMRIFSIAKRINKKITISKADDENGESWLTESYSFDLPFFWKFTYIPRYIKYFNSFECESFPIVQSEKYKYENSAELYKETKYNYYLKGKCYQMLQNIDKWYFNRKKVFKVSQNEFYIAHNLPYAVRTTL